MAIHDGNYFKPPRRIPSPVSEVTVGASDPQPTLPTPDFGGYFAKTLDGKVMGYAYCVVQNRAIVCKGMNKARAEQDQKEDFTTSRRMNLASVSKTITAIAVMKALNVETDKKALTQPFFPLIASRVPGVTNGTDYFKNITVEHLLKMKSGLSSIKDKSDLYFGDFWTFLTDYLNDTLAGPQEDSYNNMNFAICQAIVICKTGQPFEEYVKEKVLKPMAIDTDIFNTVPDPPNTATLCYHDINDKQEGMYWSQIQNIGAGGFISNIDQMVNYLAGLQYLAVLDEATTRYMLQDQLGWYAHKGARGMYYKHNGILWTDDPKPDGTFDGNVQCLTTGVVRLTDGYDCVLLVNSGKDNTWIDPPKIIIAAFEARN